MPTDPTSDDIAVVYTTEALIQRLMPKGNTPTSWGYLTTQHVGDGPSDTPGLVSPDDVIDIILDESRQLEGELQDVFYTPFPDVTATSPQLPFKIREICTLRCIDRILEVLHFGNREAPTVEYVNSKWMAKQELLAAKPNSIGIARVRTPEKFQLYQVGGTTAGIYREYGRMTGPWFRLANRNVNQDTIRFVRSDGKEAIRSDGLPFGPLMDWGVLNAVEGTIGVYNEGMIIASIQAVLSSGGGVIYDWSWVRMDLGMTGPQYPTGVIK